jgi:hypothetical protein
MMKKIIVGFSASLHITLVWIGLRTAWFQICWFFARITDPVYWSWLGKEAAWHFKWFCILGVILSIIMMFASKLVPRLKIT